MKAVLNRYRDPQNHAMLYILGGSGALWWGLVLDLIGDFVGAQSFVFPRYLSREEAERAQQYPEIREGLLINREEFDSYEGEVTVKLVKYSDQELKLHLLIEPTDCDFSPWECNLTITPNAYSIETKLVKIKEVLK